MPHVLVLLPTVLTLFVFHQSNSRICVFCLENCKKKAALLGGLVLSKECIAFTHSLPNRQCFLIDDNNKDQAKKDKANNDVKECKHIIFAVPMYHISVPTALPSTSDILPKETDRYLYNLHNWPRLYVRADVSPIFRRVVGAVETPRRKMPRHFPP